MLSFPSSPVNGQSFKANDLITYKYNSAKNLWVRMSGGSEPGATGMQGATGPAGPVSGSDTQVIFNNAGVSGADASLTFDKTAKVLTTPDIKLNAADNKIYGAATFKYLTLLPGDTNGIKFTSPTLPTELGISGPFTLEAFIKVTDLTAPFVILTAENGLWGGYSYRGDFSFEWRSDLGTIAFGWHSLMYYSNFVRPAVNSFIPDPTKWYHVAVSRDVNNNYYFFIDGVYYPADSGSPQAFTLNTQSGANPAYLIIGHFSYSPSAGGTGGVKSIRLVKDTQVYTTNFSPPAISKDLTLTQAANVNGYPSAAITGINTVVLIAQGDTINDLTAYGRTSSKYTSTAENTIVTGTSTTIPEIKYDGTKWQTTEMVVNGTLTTKGKVVTTDNIYASTDGTGLIGGSGAQAYVGSFNGSSQWLSTATTTTTPFTFGTGDFTIEYWVKYNSFPGGYTIIAGGTGTGYGGDGWSVGEADGQFRGSSQSTGYGTGVYITTNTWYHVAWARSSGTIKMYINGVLKYSTSVATNFLGTGGGIGASFSGSYKTNGYISNLRVVKGIAVYTGNFTVPIGPLTATQVANPYGGSNTAAITGTATSLLTLQNSTIVDNSTFAQTITNTGTVTTISQSSSLFGTGTSGPQGTLLFDGTKWQSTPIQITELTVSNSITATQQTKASSATGVTGQICWDSNYIYICTATNTWKRVALTGGY